MLVLRKPEPAIVRVDAAEPAGSFAGLMEVMAGVTVTGVLPPPLEEPPEHPSEPRKLNVRVRRTRREETTTERRDAEQSKETDLRNRMGSFPRGREERSANIQERRAFHVTDSVVPCWLSY
jgi:hypothetical protein